MGIRRCYIVRCDYNSCLEILNIDAPTYRVNTGKAHIKKKLKEDGWIIVNDGNIKEKLFCSATCKDKHKNKLK